MSKLPGVRQKTLYAVLNKIDSLLDLLGMSEVGNDEHGTRAGRDPTTCRALISPFDVDQILWCQ